MAPKNLPDRSHPDDPAAPDPAALVPPGNTPYWWEDPDLSAAVAEVEEFVGTAGWDAPPTMFALVRTADLLAAQPELAAALTDAGTFTPIAQDALPSGDLSEALSTISWPAEIVGCVLVQEIVVLPPSAVAPDETPAGQEVSGADGPAANGPGVSAGAREPRPSNSVEITAEQAAVHPDRAEARLAAGVLRGSKGGAALLRVRGKDDATPLRGGDLAPNLLGALHATFED